MTDTPLYPECNARLLCFRTTPSLFDEFSTGFEIVEPRKVKVD